MQEVKLSYLVHATRRWGSYYIHTWKLNALILLIAIAIGFVFYGFQENRYEAKLSFIIEESGGSIPSGLSGLASNFGVNLGSLTGAENILSGDNFNEIVRSRALIERVLYTPLTPQVNKNEKTLLDLYISSTGLSEKWRRKISEYNPSIFQLNPKAKQDVLLRDSLLGVVHTRIQEKNLSIGKQGKQGTVMYVSTTSENAEFSALFTERLIKEAKDWYINLKTEIAKSNFDQLQRRADSLHALFTRQSYTTASSQILNANEAFRSATVPAELSQREKLIQQTLYAEVVKNLELSRVTLSNQTPVILILDRPILPLKNLRFTWGEILIYSIMAGFFLSILLAFFRFPSTN